MVVVLLDTSSLTAPTEEEVVAEEAVVLVQVLEAELEEVAVAEAEAEAECHEGLVAIV